MSTPHTFGALAALLVFLAQAIGPFIHQAWGHNTACHADHAHCAPADETSSALESTPTPCSLCALIGTLQPMAPGLASATPSPGSVPSPIYVPPELTSDTAPDLTAGGARAPPR